MDTDAATQASALDDPEFCSSIICTAAISFLENLPALVGAGLADWDSLNDARSRIFGMLAEETDEQRNALLSRLLSRMG